MLLPQPVLHTDMTNCQDGVSVLCSGLAGVHLQTCRQYTKLLQRKGVLPRCHTDSGTGC